MSARDPFTLVPLPYDGKLRAHETFERSWRSVDGEAVEQYVYDETGEHRRAARIREWCATEPGVGLEPAPLTQADIENLAWQCEVEARIARDLVNAEAEHAMNWGDIYGAVAAMGGTPEQSAAAASGADGLVPVLSTQKRLKKPSRAPGSAGFTPKCRKALQEAVARQANAFLVGSPEGRMAKLRRAVGFTARAHAAGRVKGHRPDEVLMITATYAPGVEWQPNHIRTLMDHVRKWHNRHDIKCRYVWVCEIQDGKRRRDGQGRGAPHYHVALWVPVGTRLPMPDHQGWWDHGSTRIEVANRATEYLMSYLKKEDSKNLGDMPDGCRIYSVGGLDWSLRRARRWLGLPSFVQAHSSLRDDWRRAPVGTGGGWIDPWGRHWCSEFARVTCAGAMGLTRVHTHPRPADAYGSPSGPFEWIADAP